MKEWKIKAFKGKNKRKKTPFLPLNRFQMND